MKKIRVIFLLVFVSGIFSSFSCQAQTTKTIEPEVVFIIKNILTGEIFKLENGNGVIFEISNDNYLRKVRFRFDDDHDIMQFDGANLPIGISIYEKDENGDYIEDENGKRILFVRDAMSVLTKSGNLQFIFHQNGAGIRLPRGW